LRLEWATNALEVKVWLRWEVAWASENVLASITLKFFYPEGQRRERFLILDFMGFDPVGIKNRSRRCPSA
jgi:hypothetical protein